MGFCLPYGTSECHPHCVACCSVCLLCCCVWYILNCSLRVPYPTSQPIMQDANPGRDWWMASWPYFYHNFTEQSKYSHVLSCNWYCCFNTGKLFNWLCRDIVWKLRGQYLYGNVRGMYSHLGYCRMASGHLCCVRHEARTLGEGDGEEIWVLWVTAQGLLTVKCVDSLQTHDTKSRDWAVSLCVYCVSEPIDLLCVVSLKHEQSIYCEAERNTQRRWVNVYFIWQKIFILWSANILSIYPPFDREMETTIKVCLNEALCCSGAAAMGQVEEVPYQQFCWLRKQVAFLGLY